MQTVITSKGHTFSVDLAIETPNPERLYIHVINATVGDVASAFTTELPLKEYPAYTTFDSMNVTIGGVNVCLKKGA